MKAHSETWLLQRRESVLPEMDILSESAKRIGAVNTITKLPDGKLHGDNTDWLGAPVR